MAQPVISPARKAAFGILMAVERGHAHSDDLLRGKAVSVLSSADRNLATTLVLGVLRWQIQLDHQLQGLLKHPNAKLDTEVSIALRLGAFQLLHLDRIPARAAIDESVELAKQSGHRFASGMVNAVLRKLAGRGIESREPMEGTRKDLALAGTHPAWMVERWTEAFGLATACAICRHGQSQPALTVRLQSPAVEREVTEAGISLGQGELLTSARTVIAGDVTSTEAFQQGRVRLQDEGSQLVAEIAAFRAVEDTDAILDCCAAPGGKTLILAERNPQARIVACDSSPQRVEQLRERLAPLSARVECRLADATALAEESQYSLVLADVPCSGTGTLGRNPEIRHRLHAEDLARQAERQREILGGALRAVRPGGRVVYSTCSLEPEENEQVVAAVLGEVPNAHIFPLSSRIDEMHAEKVLTDPGTLALRTCLTPEGYLRLLPGAFKTDGFFVALIEKMD
jgi:16S rRNA (cytosine967-C5)-methyltransferase